MGTNRYLHGRKRPRRGAPKFGRGSTFLCPWSAMVRGPNYCARARKSPIKVGRVIGGGTVHSAVDRGPSRTRKPPTEVRSLDRTASAPLDRPVGVWSSAQAILRANHDQMSV